MSERRYFVVVLDGDSEGVTEATLAAVAGQLASDGGAVEVKPVDRRNGKVLIHAQIDESEMDESG